MKWLVNKVLKQYLAVRMKRIEHYIEHPDEVQDRWLHTLLDTAQNTEFGKRYGFPTSEMRKTLPNACLYTITIN